MPVRLRSLCLGVLVVLWSTIAQANFIIDVNYTGDSQYQSVFTNAASTWQSLLVGYKDGNVIATSPASSASAGQMLSTVKINASITTIDGAGGILGQAGPTEVALDNGGYLLTTDGNMQFDVADFSTLSLANMNSLILHEMAHVLGFGTLWTANNVYTTGTGLFTGATATSYWHSEFGQAGSPAVELGGGPGTANGHWNEVDGGGGLTGITNGLGRDMRDELMTGWLNSNAFISNMTIASFADIGFQTNLASVPEPTSMLMFASAMTGWAVYRRRSQRHRPTTARTDQSSVAMKMSH